MMVVIPFSRNIRTANLTVTVGTILFDEATKVSLICSDYLTNREQLICNCEWI